MIYYNIIYYIIYNNIYYILLYIYLFKLYKLILFSLTRKFLQILYTNLFNNHSHKITTRCQWSHKFLLLISFFWQNLTSRLNINTEVALRRCSSERVFCECAADLRERGGWGCDFNRVAYAALWGLLFCMGVLLWFLLSICRTVFWELLPLGVCFCLNIFH